MLGYLGSSAPYGGLGARRRCSRSQYHPTSSTKFGQGRGDCHRPRSSQSSVRRSIHQRDVPVAVLVRHPHGWRPSCRIYIADTIVRHVVTGHAVAREALDESRSRDRRGTCEPFFAAVPELSPDTEIDVLVIRRSRRACSGHLPSAYRYLSSSGCGYLDCGYRQCDIRTGGGTPPVDRHRSSSTT